MRGAPRAMLEIEVTAQGLAPQHRNRSRPSVGQRLGHPWIQACHLGKRLLVFDVTAASDNALSSASTQQVPATLAEGAVGAEGVRVPYKAVTLRDSGRGLGPPDRDLFESPDEKARRTKTIGYCRPTLSLGNSGHMETGLATGMAGIHWGEQIADDAGQVGKADALADDFKRVAQRLGLAPARLIGKQVELGGAAGGHRW